MQMPQFRSNWYTSSLGGKACIFKISCLHSYNRSSSTSFIRASSLSFCGSLLPRVEEKETKDGNLKSELERLRVAARELEKLEKGNRLPRTCRINVDSLQLLHTSLLRDGL
jgi:hypothetical protein